LHSDGTQSKDLNSTQYAIENLKGQKSIRPHPVPMMKMFDGGVNFNAVPPASPARSPMPMASPAITKTVDKKERSAPIPKPPQPAAPKASKNVQAEGIDSKYDVKERVDFTQTVLFTQFVNISGGQYKGSFKLSELITKFRF